MDQCTNTKNQKRRKVNVLKKSGKFCTSWINIPEFKDWFVKTNIIKNGNEFASCKICNTQILAHKHVILRHSKSEKHIYNKRQYVTNKNIKEMSFFDKKNVKDATKRAELKMCALLAYNNLPFALMDVLSPLCANIFPDSEIAKSVSLKRTKATHMIKYGLGEQCSQKMCSALAEQGCFFSLIMDETTDKGTIKQCAFTVIYYCNSAKKVVTKFFDMVENSVGTAEELFKCLQNVITLKNIPMTNVVGFSSDTTNVMFGQHNSVYSLLKKNLPHIVCVKCSCHLVHLSASKACLVLPRSVADLLRNLGAHFSRSFGRQEKLKEFQLFFKIEIHRIFTSSKHKVALLKILC